MRATRGLRRLVVFTLQTWMNARLMTVEWRVSALTPWEVSDATVIQDLRKMTNMSALVCRIYF